MWSELIAALWIAWAVYWVAMAANTKPASWQESLRSRLRYGVPGVLGALLFAAPGMLPHTLTRPLLPASEAVSVVGVVVTVIGLGFVVWARQVLGRNWSARVTVKSGHALILQGPYRLVRHPVYTGIIFALAGTALTLGGWLRLVGLALMVVAFVRKLRTEERMMRQTFPEYAEYQRHTAALIPFVL